MIYIDFMIDDIYTRYNRRYMHALINQTTDLDKVGPWPCRSALTEKHDIRLGLYIIDDI